jgi:hypothetical protein
METGRKALLNRLFTAAFFFFSFVFSGAGQAGETGQAPPPTPFAGQIAAPPPPVAQPLVPEGILAVELVNVLKVGQTQNEAEAEGMLSAIGIEPKNGWIADYPVTPDIIGEIEKSVAAAADAKRLAMGKDQAQRAVKDIEANLGLRITPGAPSPSTTPSGPSRGSGNTTLYKYLDRNGVVHFSDRYESVPWGYRDQVEVLQGEIRPEPPVEPAPEETEAPGENYAANPPPEVINNYYFENGPPVVTYYPPPSPYYYMYAWVPYPFRCCQVFFPGFFILHDFHRRVFFHKQSFVITNHVVHGRPQTIRRIDPVNRPNGKSAAFHRITPPRFASTPQTQGGARAIVTIDQQRGQSARTATGARFGNGGTPSTAPNGARRRIRYGQRLTPSTMPPAVNQRTNTNPGGAKFSGGGMMPIRPSTAERPETGSPRAPGKARVTYQQAQARSESPNPRAFSAPPISQGRGLSAPSTGGGGRFSGRAF